jgi:hypothetical protein
MKHFGLIAMISGILTLITNHYGYKEDVVLFSIFIISLGIWCALGPHTIAKGGEH